MATFLRWSPSLVALLVSALGLFQPEVQGFIMTHPSVSVVLGGLYAILTHILPAPQTPSTPPQA